MFFPNLEPVSPFFSFVALIILTVSQQDHSLLKYWPILVIISLYLPIVLVLSVKKIAIFGKLKPSSLLTLLVASFGDWLTVLVALSALACC